MTNSPPDRDDDPLAARLRAALTSEADMVQPSDDGLQNIRAGIDESGRRSWWRHPATPALAAALVLGLMAGGIAVLAGGNDDDVTVGPATSSSGSPTTTRADSPSPSPSETASSDTPTPAAIEGDVYVYYVMDDGQSPRLYRETRPNPGMDPRHRCPVDDAGRAGGRTPTTRRPGPRARRSPATRSTGTSRRSTSVASSRSERPPRTPPSSSSSTP